ncbi:hypothetical protein NDU88_001739 [Pleurodeles waltl]|uniref:Uncharacterized protein n=1 Tax=Pleurodeles waltl TaxID=8319 RepID=A0AAV7UV27_PLEWA|nr:hypothetical protein NDU88_001739 [Pleurodeles waltl]
MAAVGPARGPQEAALKEERGIHQGEVDISVRISTVNADSRPASGTTTAVSSLIRRPEDQEAATPDNRPRSGESVALAGMVLRRTRF